MALISVLPADLASASDTPKRRPLRWVLRPAIALVLVAVAVALVVLNYQVRQFEAELGAWMAAHTFAGDAATGVSQSSPLFAFDAGDKWLALRITPECAIAFVIAPFLVMFAAFALVPRFRLARIAFAVGLSVVLFVLLNQLRFLLIAFAFADGGYQGYEVAHSLVGSIVMFIGIAAIVVMSLFIVAGRRRKREVRQRRH